RFLRRKQDIQRRQFGRLARPAKRSLLAKPVEICPSKRLQRGPEWPRRHRIHPYTLLRYLLGQRFCESNDARFRLGVIEKRRGGSVSLNRTRIDNCRARLKM